MSDHSPDAALAAALRRTEPEPPLHEVDWDAMRARLAARAELPLARLRADARHAGARAEVEAPAPPLAARPRAGGSRALRWLVPLAAAAGMGGLLLGRPLPPPPGGGTAVPSAQPAPAEVQAILDATIPDRVDVAIDREEADEEAVISASIGS
ncbi:MAG TPA: hypothetical protein VFH27_11500 [Longimicrobiaceae bacterium]|nr:hypothetical protein [Longimicrobiaceae bacterium]